MSLIIHWLSGRAVTEKSETVTLNFHDAGTIIWPCRVNDDLKMLFCGQKLANDGPKCHYYYQICSFMVLRRNCFTAMRSDVTMNSTKGKSAV